MNTQKFVDWAALIGSFCTIPAALYFYSFEWLMAGIFMTLQSLRVIVYSEHLDILNNEIDQLEEQLMYSCAETHYEYTEVDYDALQKSINSYKDRSFD